MRSFRDPFHSETAASSSNGAFTQALPANAMLSSAVPAPPHAPAPGTEPEPAQPMQVDDPRSPGQQQPQQQQDLNLVTTPSKEKSVDLQSLRTNAFAKLIRELHKDSTPRFEHYTGSGVDKCC